MHSAFSGGNTVGVSVDAFVISVVPLHGDIKLHAFFFVFIFECSNFCEQRLFRMVEVLYEVDDAALVLERDCLFTAFAFISENNFKALIKKGHGLQTIHDGTRNKLNTFRRKNCWVWIERDRRSGLAAARRSRTSFF